MHTEITPIQQGDLTLGSSARTNRGFAVLVFLGAAGVLVASVWLAPDPHGYGTHRRLLFMPCWVKALTGIPCPFCGMTTAFTHLSRGEIMEALNCHVVSPLLYAITWVVAYTGLRGVITGRWPLPVWLTAKWFDRALLAAVLVGWAINVARLFL